MGKFPPPAGVTDILGLEVAGYLIEDLKTLNSGDFSRCKRVMALIPGGGNAEYIH